MNMQDNELDDLFRSKLSGLEIKPAAQVWVNIADELNGGKKSKSVMPVLSIAATVLVMLTAGTWFLFDKPVQPKPNRVASRMVHKLNTQEAAILKTTLPKAVEPTLEATVKMVQAQHEQQDERMAHIRNLGKGKTYEAKQEGTHEAKVNEGTGPDRVQTAPILASLPNKPVIQAVVPDMTLTATPVTDDAPVLKAPVSPVVATVTQPEKSTKKHGIRSLGGLINAVIAKVDKREDKLIEFTESDEDQANITGVNLGIIKIKKEK